MMWGSYVDTYREYRYVLKLKSKLLFMFKQDKTENYLFQLYLYRKTPKSLHTIMTEVIDNLFFVFVIGCTGQEGF